MSEKPIKVDSETDRLVTDLAYLLAKTKKAVVAEAVAAYAATRMPPRDSGRRPYLDLPVRQRITLRRDDLLRVFERHGASDVRLIGAAARADGGSEDDDLELVEILAETDILMGGGAAPMLAELAREILGTRVEVISATGLAFSNPAGLALLRAESVPL
jgi:hypothetical protein